MRTALVSLIALSALATYATAQEPATGQPTAPATTAAPATEAAPAAEAAPTPALQAPPAGSTAGETSTAPDPAANPTLPTSGDGAVVLQVLQNVCVPTVKAGGLDARAKAAGMKKAKYGAWILGLGGAKDYTITVQPQGANKNVCQAEVRYAIGAEKPIVNALNVYAFLHQPELPLQRNDFQVGPDSVKRITLSWEYFTDKESTGLVLVQQKKADGSPLNARYDTATLLYSERTF